MVTFPCGQIVWRVISSIPSWQQWDWDSCVCERALIGFHLIQTLFLLEWTWEKSRADGSLLAFCCQWSMSAYRFGIKWCSIPGLLCVCSLYTPWPQKVLFWATLCALYSHTLNKNINATLLFLPPFFMSWTQRSKTFFYVDKRPISLKYCSQICLNLC